MCRFRDGILYWTKLQQKKLACIIGARNHLDGGMKGGGQMMTDNQFNSYKRLLSDRLREIVDEQKTDREKSDTKLKKLVEILENELKIP